MIDCCPTERVDPRVNNTRRIRSAASVLVAAERNRAVRLPSA